MLASRFTMPIAIACAASFAILNGQTVLATILPFSMTAQPAPNLGGYESVPYASYGDNVSATTAPGPGVTYNYLMGNAFTPNITLDFSHSVTPVGSLGNSLYPAAGGWSDPVDYLHYIDTTKFWITFTPSGTIGVDINSFTIDLFAGGFSTLNWKLREGSTVGPIFASGSEPAMVASDPDRVVTIPNGAYFGIAVLEIDFTGTGNVGNIGLDDLNFDQVSVPEPSSFALLGLGAIGLAVKARRRRAAA